MDSLSNIISGRQKVPFTGVFDFTPLTNVQKNHLCRVYAFLGSSILLTALGVKFTNIFFTPPLFLSIIIQLVSIYYISVTTYKYIHGHYNLKNPKDAKRLAAFGSLSFFTGLMIAPYIKYANYINPAIVPTAFYSTLAIFICFSLSAIMSIDRKFLLLGGILGSFMSYISIMIFANIFFRSVIAHKLIVYGSLVVYMGYVLYDTQLILYDISHRGVKDPLIHALAFYGDVVGIFIKILQILAEKQEKDEE